MPQQLAEIAKRNSSLQRQQSPRASPNKVCVDRLGLSSEGRIEGRSPYKAKCFMKHMNQPKSDGQQFRPPHKGEYQVAR